jgi:murein DD-endopeptidase MepM/ murein hydrolase activator NlpD
MRMKKVLLGLLASVAITACSLPRWPVAAPLTSPYGLRLRGIWPDLHSGVDLYVPSGTPVMAMRSGTVQFAGTMGGFGTVVILSHGTNTRSIYAHLSELRVQAGDRVDGRQVIGLSGASGNATGPHLHFEIIRFGRAEDPVLLLGGFPSAR